MNQTIGEGNISETDVLIVGAGPTGLALAISLQQTGIDHMLIDKLSEGLNTSRAGVIHAHTLEMLDGLGVTQEMVGRGIKVTDFCIRDRDRTLLKLDFRNLPSKHPYLLMLPQDVTERVLSGRLASLGGAIHRNVTATAAEQDGHSARVKVTSVNGDAVIKAKYVVGGDGMHSIVRAATGTDFEGGTYEDSFILADVKMDWAFGIKEVSLFFSPSGLVVVAPLPDGVFRIVATAVNAPEHPDLNDIQTLISSRGPSNRSTVRQVIWSSRFRLHHRVAKSYRSGRFLLMGDAAHVHSPAGGQGMNTGLVDAVVLGKLLSKAIQGGEPDSVLDAYHQLRRPAAMEVVAAAGRLTAMATARGAGKRALRNLILSLANVLPPARRQILMNLSGLIRKRFAVIPAGRPVTGHAGSPVLHNPQSHS